MRGATRWNPATVPWSTRWTSWSLEGNITSLSSWGTWAKTPVSKLPRVSWRKIRGLLTQQGTPLLLGLLEVWCFCFSSFIFLKTWGFHQDLPRKCREDPPCPGWGRAVRGPRLWAAGWWQGHRGRGSGYRFLYSLSPVVSLPLAGFDISKRVRKWNWIFAP